MVGSDENYRVGFVANTGKLAVVFEPQFEDIVLDVVDGFFIVKKNGKWGTVDGNRYRMAAECIYDGVSQWRKDENGEYVATVRKDGKIYRINRNGEKL
jgi:hypothetical protein